MKRTISMMLAVFAMAIFLFACGGGAPKVQLSPEMTDFVGMIKGKAADVTAALEKHAVDEFKNDDMSMYDLREPVVVAKDGDCYSLEAKAGITVRMYQICWTGGKISKIEDKGMK